MSRKLASVQYVHDVTPIEGADRIECVHVLGWQCVAKKGEFKTGDSCVYFEVDSFLPIKPEYEFLRNGCYKNDSINGEGFRLKTQKFKGQISQGLVLPLSILPEETLRAFLKEESIPNGMDLTDILGVKKFEIEEMVTSSGTTMADFPSFIQKTDELRIQSYPELIEEFKKQPYYITTKMDGTSMTVYYKDGHVGVCGRNREYADDGKCSMWNFVHKHHIDENLRKNGKEIAIQGEFCGAGIQSNHLCLSEPHWYVFTIVDLETSNRVSKEIMFIICRELGIETVPLEEARENFPFNTVDELIERAKGKYPSGHNKEGIVIRPLDPVWSLAINGYLSAKVLNNDYLLKEEK